MKKLWWIVACIALVGGLQGCHKGGGTNSLSSLRVLNAVSDAEPIDVLVADSVEATAVAVGSTSGYSSNPVGGQDVKIRSSTTGTVLSERTVTFNSGNQTLVVYGRRASMSMLLLSDDTGSPSSGKAKVRTVNLSPEASSVDTYVTTSDLASTGASLSSVAVGSVTDYLEVNGGTANLAFTTAGTKDVRFQATGQTFTAGTAYTTVVFPSSGGQLVNAVVLTSNGGTFLANSLSRVKGVNSMGDSTGITFKADQTVLLSNVPFAASSSYVTTSAGTRNLKTEASNVPGVTIASVTQTLAPALDYSMVATGDTAQPGVTVFADQNFAPVSGTARVRFINAMSGSNTVDVLVNFAAQVSGLGPRSASDYYALGPSTTYTITFSNPGGVGVVATLTPVEIDAGLVYTVYLLGSPTAPKMVLVRDR